MYKLSLCFQNCIVLFSIILFCTYVGSVKRELEYKVNPGCNIPECNNPGSNESFLNLVHVSAVGPNDTIHYLWSTYSLPCVIIAQTTHYATLEIDWTKFQNLESGALWFTESPKQSIALILTQLLTYVDNKDTVNMTDSNDVTSLNLTDFHWDNICSNIKSSETLITALASSTHDDAIFSNNGSFKIQFSVSAVEEPSKVAPHLPFNSNSSQMRIAFDNLVTVQKGRFAAEFMAISSTHSQDKWNHNSTRSINDEYSPGVFTVHELSPKRKGPGIHSFLSWKPVSYIGEEPTVANSSDAIINGLARPTTIPPSIASVFYKDADRISKVVWNMTFGTSQDGFYDHTKYSSWSVMVGIGHPVPQEMSLLAKLVIGIGLGTPCVIMLGGGLFMLYKKCTKEEDDLLLDE